jgi:hypothetical protein
VAECIEGEGGRMYENGHVCDVVCEGCRVFFTMSHPSVLMTHAPKGMVSLKTVV